MIAILILVACVIAMALAACYAMDLLMLSRSSSRKERACKVDADYFEKRFGDPIPPVLQRLFKSTGVRDLPITIRLNEGEEQIHSLVYPTAGAIDESVEILGRNRYGFARDDFDNIFFIDVGVSSEIKFFDIETGEVTDLGCTIESLLPRK